MQKKLLYDLLRIGLTEGEAKVYLALSELGSSTVGPIVKRAGIASSNAYDILNRLLDKGIISYIIKQKVKHFQAAGPQTLLEFLQKKEQEIEDQREALNKVIPQIEKPQQLTSMEKAEVFFGQKGLKAAYKKHIIKKDKNSENLYFYIHKPRYAKESDLFYFSIVDLYTSIPSKGIANEFARKSPWFQKVKKTKVRYVDFPIPSNIDICNDSILLVSWEEKITAVLIRSKDLADNFRTYFYNTWKVAKK